MVVGIITGGKGMEVLIEKLKSVLGDPIFIPLWVLLIVCIVLVNIPLYDIVKLAGYVEEGYVCYYNGEEVEMNRDDIYKLDVSLVKYRVNTEEKTIYFSDVPQKKIGHAVFIPIVVK